ncbi:MAG: hypothetical protein IJH39_04205 [Clostridia bacterium]|nr:hypothetical protein [Clostridia bacterium]
MKKNIILDYEQAKDKLKKIEEKGIIKREPNLAVTEYGLPIEHFTTGEGKKDIVITGATHGSEIITTDFVIKLMESINPDDTVWKEVSQEFKIHFIPILNPEGYVISTSAVRKMIPREMPQEEAEKICKKYYMEYREDDVHPEEQKRYQEMFKSIDYTCIPDEYKELREAVKNIYEKYPDLPKGSLQIWSSNGNGIDIQANSEFNPKINEINEGKKVFMKAKRFSNIDISHPGPINCPFDKEKGFKYEIETAAISDLLDDLSKQGKLFLYLNYHSTGGLIFQRPAIPPESLQIPGEELTRNERVNFILSEAYSSRTYKAKGRDTDGKDKREKSRYRVMTGQELATSTNDIFRLKYPQDLLIELSGMGGNPIAPYGDINGNYTNLVESNLDATKFTFHVASALKNLCEKFSKRVQQFDKNADYETVTETEAMIFDEFSKKIMKLKPTKEAFETELEEGIINDDGEAR